MSHLSGLVMETTSELCRYRVVAVDKHKRLLVRIPRRFVAAVVVDGFFGGFVVP